MQGEPSAPNAPWPHPQQLNASSDYIYIDPNFFILYSNIKNCDIIDKAIQRYKPIFFPPKLSIKSPNRFNDSQVLISILIRITSKECLTYPQLHDDQSCKSFL